MNTTRKDYGVALATLARLYRAAEKRGDPARAHRYATAIDAVLAAWPSETDAARPASTLARDPSGHGEWSTKESTLVGLGLVH